MTAQMMNMRGALCPSTLAFFLEADEWPMAASLSVIHVLGGLYVALCDRARAAWVYGSALAD